MEKVKDVFVYNLLTGEERWYSCDAITAVKQAYAEENGLGAQFAVTLGKMDLPILKGKDAVFCGDWGARIR